MGLFSRLMLHQPEKNPSDDYLLFHALICMAAADGALEDSEVATVEAYYLSLPEFRGKDFRRLLDASNKLIEKHGGVAESVAALADIESEKVRTKAFALAVDLALCSGDLDETEDHMLDEMQNILGVDDELATKIVEVLAIKYAT